MKIDPTKWVKYKESPTYIVYLEVNPVTERTRQMLVVYKLYNRAVQCCANDSLFKLLFEPDKFRAEYLTEKQRGK